MSDGELQGRHAVEVIQIGNAQHPGRVVGFPAAHGRHGRDGLGQKVNAVHVLMGADVIGDRIPQFRINQRVEDEQTVISQLLHVIGHVLVQHPAHLVERLHLAEDLDLRVFLTELGSCGLGHRARRLTHRIRHHMHRGKRCAPPDALMRESAFLPCHDA